MVDKLLLPLRFLLIMAKMIWARLCKLCGGLTKLLKRAITYLKSLNRPGPKDLFRLLYITGGIYVTLYAVGLARYEFVRFSMDSKITNLIMLADGENVNLALARIPAIQKIKIPHEPVIYNIISSIKSLLPQFDEIDHNACEELYYLFSMHRKKIKGLHMEDLTIPAAEYNKYNELDFEESNIVASSFKNLSMKNHFFVKSYFEDVRFLTTDFSFANFENSYFGGCLFLETSFNGASFFGCNLEETLFIKNDMRESILLGADFTKSPLTNLNSNFLGAFYNSKTLDIMNVSHFYLIKRCSIQDLHDEVVPPTKFPKGFDPQKAGMIDVSMLSDDEMVKICKYTKKLKDFYDGTGMLSTRKNK